MGGPVSCFVVKIIYQRDGMSLLGFYIRLFCQQIHSFFSVALFDEGSYQVVERSMEKAPWQVAEGGL